MNSIPIAFIGGSIHSAVGNTHRIASQMDNRFKLVAGCFSRDKSINEDTARTWGVERERLYPDWQSLVESEPELVIVLLTPPPHHAEVLELVLAKNIRIICEKPITSSVQSNQKVVDLLADNHHHLHAIYNYTGYPIVREMRHIIEEGDLGEILHCEVDMPQEGFLRLNPDGSEIQPQEWRRSDNYIPTVSLDLGIHVVNLLRFVTQQHPTKVIGAYQSRGNIRGVVDHVTGLMECSNGLKAEFRYGKTSLGQSNGLTISCYGSRGSVRWVQVDPEFLYVSDPHGKTSKIFRGTASLKIAQQLRYNRFKAGHPSGFLEAFSNLYFDIANSIEGTHTESPYIFNALDALSDMKVLHAISDSVANEKWTFIK